MKVIKNKKNIVVLGGGFAGLYAIKHLRKKFGYNSNYNIILVNNNSYFLFTPLLHEVATGGISVNNAIEPLRKVARKFFDEFVLAEVESIDVKNKIVHADSCKINYDYLHVALGSETFFYGVKGAEENSFTLKSLEDALELKEHFLCSFEKASMTDGKIEQRRLLNFVVIGGGPTGVELALEIKELLSYTLTKYFNNDLISSCKVCLIQNGKALLPQFSHYFQKKSYQTLVDNNIKVIMNDGVKEVGKDFVKLKSGKTIKTGTAIWTAGVAPKNIEFKQKINKDERGRIIVNQFSQIEDFPEIFVGGDMAAFKDQNNRFLPATAQVASRQGPLIANNIWRLTQGQNLEIFKFSSVGNLISLGRWKALAQISKFKFSGPFAWWMWRTIYLIKLISFPKKLKVAIDWTLGIFSTRDISKF
jgi:NADH dehydrogenase